MFNRIFVVLALNIAASAAYCSVKDQDGQGQSQKHKAIIAQVARANAQAHITPYNDTIKLHQIQDNVYASGVISDADLDFVLNLIKHPEDTRTAYLGDVSCLVALYSLKNPSPSQQDRILQTVIPLMTTDMPNDEYGLDKAFSAHLVGIIRDKKAIPYLIPLLRDPRSGVQRRAQGALTALGYTP